MENYSKNYSDLELMVMEDMMSLGYDPLNIEDIKSYWEFTLA